MRPQPERVVISNIGLDTHDLGARLVTRALREAGMEVVYIGKFQTPESIVAAAINEDADVIGISSLAANTRELTRRVLEVLRRKEATDIAVVVGGAIAAEEAKELLSMGAVGVFGPHSDLDDIVAAVRASVERRRSQLPSQPVVKKGA